MQEFRDWDSLAAYVNKLPNFGPLKKLHGNRHLQNYKGDCLLLSLIPTDCPIRKEDALPVYIQRVMGTVLFIHYQELFMVMRVIL